VASGVRDKLTVVCEVGPVGVSVLSASSSWPDWLVARVTFGQYLTRDDSMRETRRCREEWLAQRDRLVGVRSALLAAGQLRPTPTRQSDGWGLAFM